MNVVSGVLPRRGKAVPKLVRKVFAVNQKKNELDTLLKKITLAPDENALEDVLATIFPGRVGKPLRIAFVNAHAVNLACKDRRFLAHLIESDYIFRDGSGMKILYKLLGSNPGLNLNGTDLIPRIIKRYAGSDAALLGTQEPWLSRAADKIKSKGVSPVLMMDGFQDDYAYLEAAMKQRAPLIILAMGMPKQERVAALLASQLDYPCLIICGGAILDFLGGKVTRAPALFRRFGMEWLYRLFQEPRRLFKRYVIGNLVFLYRTLALALIANRAVPEKVSIKK